MIACYCESEAECDKYGFKAGHLTSLCTSVFKRTINHYTVRGSHVFSCFIDFTTAFDRVNYWKLFTKLIDDEVDVSVVAVLAFWYSKQQMCVKWQNAMSDWFSIGNGTHQGACYRLHFLHAIFVKC